MDEQICEILTGEHDRQITLATALGKNVPDPRSAKIGTMTNACQGIRHKRIRIPVWHSMMALAANEGGSNG